MAETTQDRLIDLTADIIAAHVSNTQVASNEIAPLVGEIARELDEQIFVQVFARTLVEERLAACVNVLPPMTSIYRWKGVIEQDSEQQLVIKTSAARLTALEARVRELHPYDLPEFLVLSASGGSAGYLDWVRESTG